LEPITISTTPATGFSHVGVVAQTFGPVSRNCAIADATDLKVAANPYCCSRHVQLP
jgi:hypothetical protein